MAKAINTNFDQNIEDDVALELIDGQAPAVQTTLKNAENVYKSFLYLRKMYSDFPASERIIVVDSVIYTTSTPVLVPPMANYIVVNNYSSASSIISINGGTYTLQPGEKETFPLIAPDASANPVVAGDTVELTGTLSYIIKNIQSY